MCGGELWQWRKVVDEVLVAGQGHRVARKEPHNQYHLLPPPLPQVGRELTPPRVPLPLRQAPSGSPPFSSPQSTLTSHPMTTCTSPRASLPLSPEHPYLPSPPSYYLFPCERVCVWCICKRVTVSKLRVQS